MLPPQANFIRKATVCLHSFISICADSETVGMVIDMQEEKDIFSCPVEATLSLIGGKYKPLILWHLIEQPLHYMELQRLIPKATAKMLSQQLRDLQQSGLVSREVIPEKPPKTIYSLTPFGRSIIPVLEAMCNWGTGYLDGLDVQTPCCPSTKK